MVEIIGLIATAFVLISFLVKDIKLIRAINIIGAVLFVVYGLLNHSVSVWFLNGVLVLVHIYHLIKLKSGACNNGQ